jgi:hypothetical protein
MEVLLDNVTCCPLVQLRIEPDGSVAVLSSADKTLHGGWGSPGSSSPSCCSVPAALAHAAAAAGGLVAGTLILCHEEYWVAWLVLGAGCSFQGNLYHSVVACCLLGWQQVINLLHSVHLECTNTHLAAWRLSEPRQ